jgi:hypothetical protein
LQPWGAVGRAIRCRRPQILDSFNSKGLVMTAKVAVPEDKVADISQTERTLTAADVLSPDQFYTFDEVAARITGIPKDEFTSKAWPECRRAGSTYGDDGQRATDYAYLGRRISEWIETKGYRYTITDEARRLWERLHHAPTAKTAEQEPQQPVSNVVAKALERRLKAAQASEQEEAKRQQEATMAYRSILLRDALGKSKPSDAAELAAMVDQLDLDAEQLESDASFIRRALELQSRLDGRKQAEADAIPARAKVHAIRKEYHDKMDEAERVLRDAENRQRLAAEADAELTRMRTQRPEFFALDGAPRIAGT